MTTVNDIFEEENEPAEAINVTPELKKKIRKALVALEQLLLEAFPGNIMLNQILVFLASYVKNLFR